MCIFLGLCVYNFVVSFHVFPLRPSPNTFTHNPPCKNLEASCVVPQTFFSYNYLTFDYIKCLYLSFLWVLLLLSNITLINVRYIHFNWNLSLLPRRYETKFSISHTFQSWVYVFTFLYLFEPFLLIFAIDKSLALYFPSKNTLVAFKKSLYSKIYMTFFLSFKYLIMSIVFLYPRPCPSRVLLFGIFNL